jgi:SOS response regulatory protein OraA/RecX
MENKGNEMTEETKPMTFADKWHAEKLLKRTKKKARKQLQQKGFSKGEATKLVKQSVNRIAARPTSRGASRGG